jgi:hypothetical protein
MASTLYIFLQKFSMNFSSPFVLHDPSPPELIHLMLLVGAQILKLLIIPFSAVERSVTADEGVKITRKWVVHMKGAERGGARCEDLQSTLPCVYRAL